LNPHAERSISPIKLFMLLKTHRKLIYNLIRRDVVGRYRGSMMGLLWSFFNPLLMLIVYTFVFSIVFKARWIGGSNSKAEFALVLFSGLMMFNLFSECLSRAPSLILTNANYVKKVVFPLEILPIVVFGASAFHFFINFLVWLVFYMIFFGTPPSTIFQLPLAVMPLVMMILGFSWFLASLGVYLRDVSQVIGVIMTVLLFLSPIFYPIAALPLKYQAFMHVSPLTFAVEQMRDVMIWGKGIDWVKWQVQVAFSIVIFWLGFAWFQKTRKGFADVL